MTTKTPTGIDGLEGEVCEEREIIVVKTPVTASHSRAHEMGKLFLDPAVLHHRGRLRAPTHGPKGWKANSAD